MSGLWQQGLHASDVSVACVCLSYYWHSVVLRLPAVLSDCQSHLIPSLLLEMLCILLGHTETRDVGATWQHKSAVM